MKILKKITRFLNGETKEEQEKQEEQPQKETSKQEKKEKDKSEILSVKQKEEIVNTDSTTKKQKVKKAATNIVELEELTMVKIMQLLKAFSYSDIKIQRICFHLKNKRTDLYSVRAEKLFTEPEFLDNVKAALDTANIKYTQSIDIQVFFQSKTFEDYTKITQQVSIEVLTPKEAFEQKEARITTLNGVLEKEEYILTPKRKKAYLIGRGKAPKLNNGIIIKNDIVFAEPNGQEELEINRNVSRSILFIAYNPETNKYEIGRTGYMFNSNHIVKVIRRDTKGGQKEMLLNTQKIRVPLKPEDMIIINGKVNILFELIE